MLKLIFAALFCVQAFARPSNDLPTKLQVIGGTPAKEGQFPFIVSLKKEKREKHFCGGALISNTYVLTAAHCVTEQEPDEVVVGVGSVNLESQEIYDVEQIITHPQYNSTGVINDIALLKLSSPIPVGRRVQTILPYSANDTLDDKMVSAMGWGYTEENGPESPILLYLDEPIVSNDICRERLEPKGPVGPGNICLGSVLNHGMCFGDSGSPLAYKATDGKTYVVGLVSWGVACAKGYPDVFTRVSHYIEWIKENME